MNTKRARCRSSTKENKTQNTWPTHDDVLLTTDRQFKHYKPNEDRTILKDGLLFRKYYGQTGSVKNYQILIPKQLIKEVLRSLHGEFGKHPGITKTKKNNKMHIEKNIIIRIWLNYPGSGLCHVSNALKSHRLIPNSTPPPPCKLRKSTLLRQKTPCKLI